MMWTEFQSACPSYSLETDEANYINHLRLATSAVAAFDPAIWHFKYTVSGGWTDFLRVRLPLGVATDGLTTILNRGAPRFGLAAIVPRSWNPVAACLATNAGLSRTQIDAILVVWHLWSNAITGLVATRQTERTDLSPAMRILKEFAPEYFDSGMVSGFATQAELVNWPRGSLPMIDARAREAGFFSQGSPVRLAGTHLLANSLNLPYQAKDG